MLVPVVRKEPQEVTAKTVAEEELVNQDSVEILV